MYIWKRFWHPRESGITLDYSCCLPDPESEWGSILNPHVVAFDTLVDIPCLGLLGEPGIGKSHAMQLEKAAIDTRIQSHGDETLWINLRSYGSESRLIHDLFESPAFASWREANYQLHIFLDSLDECLLKIANVATLLIEEFAKYPHERLFLRIACRTADWPDVLESGLREVWGKDAVQVYEIAPLRRKDIVEAADAEGLNVDGFLREIDQKEVVPLAIKPITLIFLLNKFRKDAELPSRQVDLYEAGCRLLCEETNPSRIASRATGTLNADQRLTVAARIAAITIFANRFAIWSGVNRGDIPEEDVTIEDLYGGQETVKGNSFEINDDVLRETLSTGLFVARGANRLGWAHQTYAEFLAARYVTQHNMSLAQVMGLLLSSGESGRKLVPQLRETAAWLASLRPDVFHEIVKLEPEMVLRSDVATADPADRAALVQALLDGYDTEQLIDWDWGTRRLYRKLAHPRLAEQIRPFISDRAKGIMVRRVATDIAESCEEHDLENDLLTVVLDPTEALSVRENAAYALWQIGSDNSKAKMKPLAAGKGGHDPNDILKGYGLLVTWPEHLTAQELFDCLTPPKNESLYGAYQQFLYSGFSEQIQPADLPLALSWVTELHVGHKVSYHLEEPIDAILLRAWQYLDSPGVLDAFTRFALAQFQLHRGLLGSDFPHGRSASQLADAIQHEENKRHQFLLSVLPRIESKDAVFLFTQLGPRLVTVNDIPWMIEYGLAVNSPAIKSSVAHLISWIFDKDNLQQIEAVFLASKQDSVFDAELARYFSPLAIDSPEAQEQKTQYLEMQRWQQPREETPLEPPPAERIAKCLEAVESGDTEKWWSLCMEMTLELYSTHYGNELEADLYKLPGWISSDATTRSKIVQAAKKYVLERDSEPDRWLGTNVFYRPAAAGYKALYLLMEEDPDFLSALPTSVWQKWAPIVAAYPREFGEQKDTHRLQLLLKLAYRSAPNEVIDVVMNLIDKENTALDNIFAIRAFEDCWDACLANAILTKAKDKKLKPSCMGDLLQSLLKHGNNEAGVFAQSMVSLPIAQGSEERARAFAAAYALLTCTQDAGWSVVWLAVQQDTQFGREVFEAVAYHDISVGNVWSRLNESQLSDLYIWLVHQYPFEDDPHIDGGHAVSPREQIAHWRDTLLSHLQGRGTYEACEGIRRIVSEFPDRLHIKRALLEAQTLLRRRTWTPIRPRELLRLADDNSTRYVQSGEQLLAMLVESLRRLEQRLHDETPAVVDLWNEVSKEVYRPKDENRLSDYVKRHLDEDLRQRGVIVNREVEIRRGEGASPGERTDIHVDAVVHNSQEDNYDVISAIIETKGCWHPELESAMETQLVNRYLKDNHCQHGIYLVGWFNCEQWDKDDPRRKRAPSLTIAQAQEQFDKQAMSLSARGSVIQAVVLDVALR
jgi:predicted NACHT family NTPase